MATDPSLIAKPLFLVGATGTGKSAAAMEVAREWARGGVSTAILCMDAMQVYRGADIGTSKPTVAERAEIPHGGLDLVDFGQPFDAAQYLKHAADFLREQREAGRQVLIVGGTGLYFRALTRGLCEAPQGSDELRRELASLSVAELQERLRKIDPAMLERIDAANPRRLARAIEVMEATGRSLREWQEETPEPLVKDFKAWWIQRKKAELEERIAQRVEAMFSQGWVEEVRGLIAKHGADAVWNFSGIGYREIGEIIWEMVKDAEDPVAELTNLTDLWVDLRAQVRSQVQLGSEGTGGGKAISGSGQSPTLQELKSDILVATRQYAKRQLTWFAREPTLEAVMLSGNESFSTAARRAGAAPVSI